MTNFVCDMVATRVRMEECTRIIFVLLLLGRRDETENGNGAEVKDSLRAPSSTQHSQDSALHTAGHRLILIPFLFASIFHRG